MTNIETSRTVRREVQLASTERGIIELTREGIYIREKGRRTKYGPVSYTHVFMIGARMKAEAAMKERQARRKSRRKSHRTRKTR